ncbi:hypothetical protein ACHHYP_01610 [Achlya hypogyna]|uniref:N-acetyltransferase domain-containing protein n=1 Tax=Achlya hypogyna TaxID=1202772 RepID=A0A1V9ZTA2_ACHHY|nr:hypothetical protein ACHHYP_01610 [Achlya hypogyna]
MVFVGLPTSARLTYVAPAPQLDEAVYEIFCQETTMQYIPFLYRMPVEAWAARRSLHRSMMTDATGACFDVLNTATGAVVGTCGFRVIDLVKGEAEWGVILSETSTGLGYCREMHDACMAWAKRQGVHRVTAATWTTNSRMNELLLRYGWTFDKLLTDDFGDWNEYSMINRDP